jgi:peptidoglycan/xylan/chitin deacetylase (PgdA/CDA1 family)
MKRAIKSALFFCLYYSGLEYLLARLVSANAVAVLMYHGVCEKSIMPPEIDFHLSPTVFDQHMKTLKKRYPFVSLQQLSDVLAGKGKIAKGVVVTFDDGYKNNLTQAAPILQEYGIPYVVFVVTSTPETRWMPLNLAYVQWSQGKITAEELAAIRKQLRESPVAATSELRAKLLSASTQASLEAEECFAMMDWQELRALQASGAEIAAHTHSHCNMAVENDQMQKQELATAKSLLEKNLGHPITAFAYPYGRTSSQARDNVEAAGYDCAVSTQFGLCTADSDRFMLPRIGFEKKIWMFTGELLLQFVKQMLRPAGKTSVQGQQNA